MKNQGINLTMVLLFLISGWITAQAQDQIEVPGDNFSLEGALELFKKSASPEEFEKMLNDPETKVNNLDLNGDEYIDYIRVIDRNEKNVHVFIMQAVVSETQAQDVAVITLEKLANGKAVLQITGDEDVYGVETIIEPTAEVRTYGGTRSSRAVVNVWAWPSVQFIYGPYYSGWVSPWGWGYRPMWWRPWRPIAYYNYYPYWRPYRPYYSPCYVRRVVYAEHIYRPHRTTSVVVVNRNREQIQRYRSNHVNNGRTSDYARNSSSARQRSTSARYDANGRISASSNSRTNSRSLSNIRIQSDNERSAVSSRSSSNARSGSNLRTGSSSSNTQSSTRVRSNESSGNSTSNARQSRVPVNVDRNRSSEQKYQRGSSTTPNSSRSYSSSSSRTQSTPNVQRSSGSSNARQSSKSYSSRGSSSGSSAVQRSSGSSGSNRSSGYSSGSSSSRSSGVSSSSGRSSSGSSQRSTSSGSQRGGRR